MKSMYRYKFRSLTDPPEFYELEAGPFEPFAAGVFGQTEAGNQAMQTGKAWVCHLEPINDPVEPHVESIDGSAEPSVRWAVLKLICTLIALVFTVYALGVLFALLRSPSGIAP